MCSWSWGQSGLCKLQEFATCYGGRLCLTVAGASPFLTCAAPAGAPLVWQRGRTTWQHTHMWDCWRCSLAVNSSHSFPVFPPPLQSPTPQFPLSLPLPHLSQQQEAASLLLSNTTQCSLSSEDLLPGSSYVARVRARPGQASGFSGQHSQWSTEVSWKTPEGSLGWSGAVQSWEARTFLSLTLHLCSLKVAFSPGTFAASSVVEIVWRAAGKWRKWSPPLSFLACSSGPPRHQSMCSVHGSVSVPLPWGFCLSHSPDFYSSSFFPSEKRSALLCMRRLYLTPHMWSRAVRSLLAIPAVRASTMCLSGPRQRRRRLKPTKTVSFFVVSCSSFLFLGASGAEDSGDEEKWIGNGRNNLWWRNGLY